MKKSIWAICLSVVLCGSAVLAASPSQDKPVTKTTTTTVKKATPVKVKTTAKTVHKSHVKQS